MNVALCSLNVSFIHKNLALRWLMVSKPESIDARVFESTTESYDPCIKDIVEYQADVLGLSCYIFNIEATKQFILKIKEYLPELNPMCSHIDCENNLMLVPFFAINSGTIETVHHRCEKLKNLYNASSVSMQLISPDDYGLECETNYYLLNYYERELKNISLVDIRSTN